MTPLPPAYVVTTDPDRLLQFRRGWSAVGLPEGAVKEWKGLELHAKGQDQQLGNAIAQYALVRHAIASGFDSILVFEDDAMPCDDATTALPAELEAARARGDYAVRLGWLMRGTEDELRGDGSCLGGSHAYALLSRDAMEDYCDAWTRNGKADYVFGMMTGKVGMASKCLFAQHVPSGKRGIHFPEGWVLIRTIKELREQHDAFVKASAAIGVRPPEFSGT